MTTHKNERFLQFFYNLKSQNTLNLSNNIKK
ncbi:hypothetical protein HDEF_1562 [Candidatus Hamiltonella defensa 5AT (Acyrthosiphon pisum)]|uniref:Uncharacterized protein n=1 Tax=Hamiltonella defensa subsp. Acyrthosiphon pisum (strain 5AT) TaxID=572265 RepID=C4K6I4_HAMD5|nr:hypothetical protein HDEF_1562 [Candidatus Hamiltonella defensa 5AT (Acyrthosiphon pisum)]